jgi:general secretion pathway protein H
MTFGQICGNYLRKADGGIMPLSAQPLKVRSSNEGFTMLELLIVMFIIGLVGVVVMFSASRLQENTLFNTEARKLYLTVKHAREVSILERRDIVFKVDADAKKYWIDYGEDKTSETHSLPQKYVIAGEAVNFFPKGNSSGGRFELDNGKGRKYEVTVDPVLGTTAIKRL